MGEGRKILLFKVSLLLSILLLGGLVFSGCRGFGAVPKGWSGGVIADETLFIGSMDGKLVALEISDGSRLWEVPLERQEETGGGFGCAPASTAVAIYGSPAVAGDLVYVGGYNGKIYALVSDRDRPREEPRWVYPRQGNIDGAIVGGPVVAQGKVYFASSDGKVYALDAADGHKEWVFDIGDKIWSTPAIDGDTLFIGSFDKKLYALDATDGSQKWEFETEGAIVAAPVVYNNTVYFGSFDRHLYAVSITSGQQIWKFPASDEDENKPGNWFWSKPVIYNDVVYAACLDGKVYALDAESGHSLVWFDLGSSISSSPVQAGDLLIVATEEGVVYAIDISTKREEWVNGDLKEEKQKIYASLCAGGGMVYIHTSKGELHVLNVQSGAKLWSLSLGSK